jgi:hypothetical protein
MSDDNVVILPVVTTIPIPVERILTQAMKADLKMCIIIGENEDGSLYFSSSEPDGGDVLWQLEKAKLALLHIGGAWPGEPTGLEYRGG